MSESESLRIHTAINPNFMRYTLMKGTLLAGLGILILSVCGVYMPPKILNIWGLPVLFVGMGLITWGMLPYRKLKRLEDSPDELVVIEESYLVYLSRGTRLLTIPIRSIEKFTFIERGREYGIGIHLKNPLPEKIVVHNRRLNLDNLLTRSRKKFGCDLYLPFFSKRAYSSLAFLELGS